MVKQNLNLKMDKSNFELKKYLKNIDDLLDDSINDILDDAKAKVPVKSGKLKNSLKVTSNSENEKIISSDVDYAYFVENGTRNQKASKFLYKAVTKNKNKIISKVEEQLKKNIK